MLLLTAANAWMDQGLLEEELAAHAHLAAQQLVISSFGVRPEGLQNAAALALRNLPDGAFVALRGADGDVLALAVSPGLRLDPSGLGDVREGRSTRELHGELLEESTAVAPGDEGAVHAAQVGLHRGPTEARAARSALTLAGLGLLLWLCSVALGVMASRSLARPLETLARSAHAVACGQLEALPAVQPQGELEALASAFRSMVESLQTTHRDFYAASSQIAWVVEELHVAAASQTEAANLQWDSMRRTGQALDEMTATRQLAVDHTAALILRAQDAEQLSSEGMRVIGEALSALQDLSQDVREIAQSIARQSDLAVQVGSIAVAVKDLAEQSNLLALNAAVEAARAGERGLGFTVVAQEMRALAAQSKEASVRIRATLADANRAMRDSLKLAEASEGRAERAGSLALGAGDFIGKIAEAVRESYLGAKEIESSTQRQTRSVDEIAEAMTGLSATAQRTRDGSAALTAVAGHLGELSARLASLLQRFSLGTPPPPMALGRPPAPPEAAPSPAPEPTPPKSDPGAGEPEGSA